MRRSVLLWASVALSVGCVPFESSVDAGVSYSTTATPWASDAACVDDESPGVAKEMLSTQTFMVIVAGGDKEISSTAWSSFEPPSGWNKNSSRALEFTGSCFARSPYADPGCQGEACRTVVEVGGHSWIELSQILSVDCLPSGGACSPMGLGAGELAVIVTRKCHRIMFEGEVIFLEGPDGEKAVLHAAVEGNAPTMDVDLPSGWTLSKETLETPLVVHPFGGEGQCYYNIIRDAAGQSYHQISYAGATYP